ncbi:MAG TPA: cupin domain-containing protein, partial [Homoserinimonas sp.]|nr:cupin domain-containing protein [Homoserinimonas sp.]
MELTNSATTDTGPITFWPAVPIEPMTENWPGMRTRDIVPIAEEGWTDFAFSEWDLEAAVWEDDHPHSEVNLVIEGELHIAVGGEEVVLGPGDAALVPAGRLGRYWAPVYARMAAVYGPNPEGLESTAFNYWDLQD